MKEPKGDLASVTHKKDVSAVTLSCYKIRDVCCCCFFKKDKKLKHKQHYLMNNKGILILLTLSVYFVTLLSLSLGDIQVSIIEETLPFTGTFENRQVNGFIHYNTGNTTYQVQVGVDVYKLKEYEPNDFKYRFLKQCVKASEDSVRISLVQPNNYNLILLVIKTIEDGGGNDFTFKLVRQYLDDSVRLQLLTQKVYALEDALQRRRNYNYAAYENGGRSYTRSTSSRSSAGGWSQGIDYDSILKQTNGVNIPTNPENGYIGLLNGIKFNKLRIKFGDSDDVFKKCSVSVNVVSSPYSSTPENLIYEREYKLYGWAEWTFEPRIGQFFQISGTTRAPGTACVIYGFEVYDTL